MRDPAYRRRHGGPLCEPRSPWQRGINEDSNGFLRLSFPEITDLCAHSPTGLASVGLVLNTRPRKSLNQRASAEDFNGLL
jgi:IS30 family transposase